MTANEQYQANSQEIARLISRLQDAMGNHRAEFNNGNDGNWGYPGDLKVVIEYLSNAVEYLEGELK